MQDTKQFYQGDARADGMHTDGWFVGHFIPDEYRHTGQLELKYWHFEDGPVIGRTDKICEVLEITMVLTGEVHGHINHIPTIVRAGEYVIIPAGVINNMVESAHSGATGLTIKTPSFEGSTKRL